MSSPPDTNSAPETEPAPGAPTDGVPRSGRAALTLGALGVVYGDIGTSPLYAVKQAFGPEPGLRPDPATVYGVLSLIFWSITIVVSVKYVLLVTRADNAGEGGTMALISLVRRARLRSSRTTRTLVALGIVGAALFFGDAVITPAVSVLGAVEGLEIAVPGLQELVVPIAIVLLVVLFAFQRVGTETVGRAFGPVMVVWFVVIGVLGVVAIAAQPAVLLALSPTYAVQFFLDRGVVAFLALGAVVLVITGSEALYADIGHFGRPPIRRAWFALVLPALMLNYLGQGALLLSDPTTTDNPFFRLVPAWAQIPILVLATLAAVIASQAVITGTYSLARQAVQLGYLPFLTIRHTSEREFGRIYVPLVNGVLFVAVLALVVGFGSSTALASAYGIAVTGTLVITTILFVVVVRHRWHQPLWLVVAVATAFLVVELAFLASNATKIVSGGWFPLSLGGVVFAVLMTWHRGREIVSRHRSEEEGPLQGFVDHLACSPAPPLRVPGTAVFLSASVTTTPLALRHNVEQNHVLHAHVVILNVENAPVPHVTGDDRIDIDDLRNPHDGISLVTARLGFHDRPDLPAALRLARDRGLDVDPDHVSWFLSRVTITPTGAGGMARWRKRLFTVMSRNAASPVTYFELPENDVVSFGSSIEV